eukprot:5182971-Ditylum_brightwellii.AAC.1
MDKSKQHMETSTSISNNMQKIAQTWKNLIFGSGGKIAAKKTYWWLIWWNWGGEKASRATKEKLPMDLSITIGWGPQPLP